MKEKILFYGLILLVFLALLVPELLHRGRKRNAAEQRTARTWDSDVKSIGIPLVTTVHLLLILAQVLRLVSSRQLAFTDWFARLLALMICMGIFDLALYLLLPLLRRRASARVCAQTWILPCLVCVVFSILPFWPALSEKKLFTIPVGMLTVPALIWLAGFVGVLLWQLVSHLRFRRKLLRGAVPAPEETKRLLLRLQDRYAPDLKAEIPVVVSAASATPLSIGLWRRTIRIVLPETAYSPEEMDLILRHELTHILLRDPEAKLYRAFCAALCWFNPLQWLGMARSAEDLELRCDELVTEDLSEDEKKCYAELLLRTAGSTRGFSTCLSASARGLRYRLKRILTPARRRRGPWIAALPLCCFFLSLAFCSFNLCYGSVDQYCLKGQGRTGAWTVSELGYQTANGWHPSLGNYYQGFLPYEGFDEDALLVWLTAQELLHRIPETKQSSGFDPGAKQRALRLRLLNEAGEERTFLVTDGGIHCLGNGSRAYESFDLSASPDWTALEALLGTAADPNVNPHPGDLTR